MTFAAFLDANIMAGADYILDVIGINEPMQWADLDITGEGMIDSQTFMNKAPYAVAMRAKKFGKHIFAIGRSISLVENNLFDGLFSIINKPMDLEEAIENAGVLTYHASKELAKLINSVSKK